MKSKLLTCRIDSDCRACVGKNLATLELFVIIATVFRRYEFVLESDEPVSTFWC